MKFYLILGLFVMSVSSIAQNTTIGDVDMGEVNNSKAFEQIKKMLGKWEGKLYQQSGAVVDTSSEFKLVSNGNTIVEKLVEDGVEMMTTYSDKDGELVIKHYCALGTEPMFKVAKLSNNSISFESDPSPGYHKDHHNFVNSISWKLSDKDTLSMKNSIFLDGKIENNKAQIKRVY